MGDRRSFLLMGGAALLAACGKKKKPSAVGATTPTSVTGTRDAVLLRTASSIEELEVAVYQRGLDAGVIKTPGLVDTVKLLQAQHKSHSSLFAGHTSRVGGQPFTQPNPVLMQQLQSRLASMSDESAFLQLAFDVAQMAAATYQAAVTNVDDHRLNLIMMSVAGVEARHAALFGGMIDQQLPTGSFATTEKAVGRGTGV
jgi:hypothetical protein